ncbi:MAG TPA: VOC family protein [Oculatellaceae cyanobacterium]
MKLNHLHIKTTDLPATKTFYEKYFGFTKAFDHPQGEFLIDEGGFLLAIFAYKNDEPQFQYPAWFHFGFCLTDEALVRTLYAQMEADNVRFAETLTEYDDGTVKFDCLDPGGHKIEVSWNPDEAPLFSDNGVLGMKSIH